MAPEAPRARSLLAVDTNVLMELGGDCAATHNSIVRLRAFYGFRIVAPQTVIQELAHGLEIWGDSPKGHLALAALTGMTGWGIEPIGLVPVGNGICDAFYDEITRRGYLPVEERNDALILAEAGLVKAEYLLTCDNHLLDIPQKALQQIFQEKDLHPTRVIHPSQISKLRS